MRSTPNPNFQIELETARLRLRPYLQTEAQRANLIGLLTDPEVMKFVGDGVMSEAAAERLWQRLFEIVYAENRFGVWAIWTSDNSRFVGSSEIKPRPTKPEDWEIGYILRPDAWRKGYATEIAQKLVDFGFGELNLPEIYATVDDDNFASIHVLEKVGMTFERFEYDRQGRFSVYAACQTAL